MADKNPYAQFSSGDNDPIKGGAPKKQNPYAQFSKSDDPSQTIGGYAKDAALDLTGGVLDIGKSAYGAANLATGGYLDKASTGVTGLADKAVTGIGNAVTGNHVDTASETPTIAQGFEDVQKDIGGLQTDYRHNLEEQRQKAAEEAYKNGGILPEASSMIANTVMNPSLLAADVLHSAPSLLLPGMAAKSIAGSKFAQAAVKSATARALANGASEAEAEKVGQLALEKLGENTVTGANALQVGAGANVDAINKVSQATPEQLAHNPNYQALIQSGMNDQDARQELMRQGGMTAGEIATPISAIANKLSGAAGQLSKVATGKYAGSGLGGAATAAAKEIALEVPQSGGQAFSQNVADQQSGNPNADLAQGVGAAAAQGALSGVAMGVGEHVAGHAMSNHPEAQQVASQDQQVASQDQSQLQNQDASAQPIAQPAPAVPLALPSPDSPVPGGRLIATPQGLRPETYRDQQLSSESVSQNNAQEQEKVDLGTQNPYSTWPTGALSQAANIAVNTGAVAAKAADQAKLGSPLPYEGTPAKEHHELQDAAQVDNDSSTSINYSRAGNGTAIEHAQSAAMKFNTQGKDISVIPHADGGYTLAPTDKLTPLQRKVFSNLQPKSESLATNAQPTEQVEQTEQPAAKQVFPFKTQAAAQKVSTSIEQKTGISQDVIPHPTIKGNFALTPTPSKTENVHAPVPQTSSTGDVMNSAGKPYASKYMATKALMKLPNKESYFLHESDDGFVLRPKVQNEQSNEQGSNTTSAVDNRAENGNAQSKLDNTKRNNGDEIGHSARPAMDRSILQDSAVSNAGKQTAVASTDRRQDTAQRKRVAEMTPKEMKQALLVSDVSGIGNGRAYEEAEAGNKKPIKASMDLDSLAWINDTMGHGAGDAFLKATGQAIKDVTENVYHKSGDEFIGRFDSEEEGHKVLGEIRNRLADATIEATLPDGTIVRKKGIGFSYGLDKDLKNADFKLGIDKADRQTRGERVERKAEPSGVSRIAPEGQQNNKGDVTAKEEVKNINEIGRDGLRQSDRDSKNLESNVQEFAMQVSESNDESPSEVLKGAKIWAEEAGINEGKFRRELHRVWSKENSKRSNELAKVMLSGEEIKALKPTSNKINKEHAKIKRQQAKDREERLNAPAKELGIEEGDTITTSKDIGYMTAEKPMKVTRISGGTMYVSSKNGSTSEKLSYIAAEVKRGAKISVEKPSGDLLGKENSQSIGSLDKSLFKDAASGKSAKDILKTISEQSENPQYKELAQALLKVGVDSSIEIGKASDHQFAVKNIVNSKFAAGYDPKTDKVYLFKPSNTEQNLLHELTHAATFKALRNGGLAATQMKALYDFAKKIGNLEGEYGISNRDEFVAEAFSNPEFQAKLQAMAAPKTSAFKSAWDWLVNSVRSLLGMSKSQTSVLDEAMRIGKSLISENAKSGNEKSGMLGKVDTETSNFKKWFGDSKVVDKDGKPLVVYHGSTRGGIKQSNSRISFFSLSKDVAKTYSEDDYSGSNEGNKIIQEVFIRIENPLIVDANGSPWMKIGFNGKNYTTEGLANLAKQLGHDGVIIKNVEDNVSDEELPPSNIYVTLGGKAQIKSATGNSGEFDVNNLSILGRADIESEKTNTVTPKTSIGAAVDIVRSANTIAEGAKAVKSILLSSDRKFGLWDRTVGTQFNKASKDADFKKVFDAFNQQTNDIAHYAIESESLAPDVLQRLEGIKDIGRALMQSGKKYAADIAKVSEALFSEIEYKKGVQQKVYSSQELASQFGLNDRQIGMYKQVRLAVDTSLDRLAQSVLMTMAEKEGFDSSQLKNMPLDATAEIVKQNLKDVSRETVDALLAENKFLKDSGYMPASRFGDYAVTVRNPNAEKGERPLFFKKYESQKEANIAKLQAEKKFPGMDVTSSVMNSEQYKMFKGVNPESVELYSKFTGMDKSQAMRDFIALAKSERSTMKNELQREGISGFSKDTQRVLAQFISSNARQAALNINGGKINEALASKELAKKGDVQLEAQKLADYMQNTKEEAQKLRGFLFMNFLGGSVASAVTNLTQTVLQTAPYLTQYSGAKTASIMASSAKMAITGKITNPELKAAMVRAKADGITDPHEIHQLMADAAGSTLGTSLKARALTKAWGSFFSLSEAFNRRLTFIAAYQSAMQMGQAKLEEKGFKDAYAFASKAIIETQGLYAKENRPNWARGAVGASLFTFKQFSISYVEFLNRLPPKQKAIALATLILAAGVQGLPFAEDVEDIIDTIGQSLGHNTNSKKALREWSANMLGPVFGAIMTHGLTTQAGIDMQGRLGLGNLIPGTSMFKESEQDKGRDIAEIAGPVGAVLQNIQNAVTKAQKGNITGNTGALAALAPTAIQNALKAAEMYQTGQYKDSKERNVIKVTVSDAIAKMFGFQPNTVAAQSRVVQDVQQDIGMMKAVQSGIADNWSIGIVDKDPKRVQESVQAMIAWNKVNPDSKIQIKAETISSRVKQMMMSREQRDVKSSPSTIRAQVAQELK